MPRRHLRHLAGRSDRYLGLEPVDPFRLTVSVRDSPPSVSDSAHICSYTVVDEDAVLTGVPTRSAVEELYSEHGERLWRAVLAFSGDRAVADDSVAEAFAQLLRRGDAVRSPGAWVWTAAFRIATEELRKRSRVTGAPPPDAAYEMPDPLPQVIAALATLPTVQRTVVVMHDYADRPTGEIAHTLGIARSTVRVHLSKARTKLRAILEESL